MDWGQPYSCSGWAETFGLSIPILDDNSGNAIYGLFGIGYVPHNVVIGGNGLVIFTDSGFNSATIISAIEEGLENFAGCAVIISHDRWFLDRVCTHILAFEGNSEVYYFEGSYSDYEENKLKRLGISEPKRIRYKKLMND